MNDVAIVLGFLAIMGMLGYFARKAGRRTP